MAGRRAIDWSECRPGPYSSRFRRMPIMNESPRPARFPTTCWSRVARAGGPPTDEARAALAELCGVYWYPIYALIRRRGHGADEALDLTQDYFARLLENGTVTAADPDKGVFRSFLLTDCWFFVADRRDSDRARKRGGGRPVLSIDARDAEGRFLSEPSHDRTPERMFERDWALALIARVFEGLERHYADTGRSELFRRLKPFVSSAPDTSLRATVAVELGLSDGNVRVILHRLRTRFAAALREEVAATLRDAGDGAVEDESPSGPKSTPCSPAPGVALPELTGSDRIDARRSFERVGDQRTVDDQLFRLR